MSTNVLGTRSLKIMIDGEEGNVELTSTTIETAASDADVTTWSEAAAGGGRTYTLKGTALQDLGDPDSILNKVWDHSGEEVDVIVNPYGVGTLSSLNPGVSGTVIIKEADGVLLGGDADASTSARLTFPIEWDFKAKPVRITSGSYGD